MQSSSTRYTTLSDRFRTLWTFSQFLRGVLNHLGEAPMPYNHDFQALHAELKELVQTIGIDDAGEEKPELDRLERELNRIHRDLALVENGFAPSVMRKFFDHIKRQDEKVLTALAKFYLLSKHFEQDTLDKLDILFTRLAEEPSAGEQVAARESAELLQTFASFAEFTNLRPMPLAEETPLIDAVTAIRDELETIEDHSALVESRVYERYRRLKQRLGKSALHPSLLVEITTTNIVAKTRFKELFNAEEKKVAENTRRIYDIERYLDRHPELANEELRHQIEEFRHARIRYESSVREGNVRRDDITGMTLAMQAVLDKFDPTSNRTPSAEEITAGIPIPDLETGTPSSATNPTPDSAEEPELLSEEIEPSQRREAASLADVLPLDPLLNESLHKIMFALEMVVWDRLPSQIVEAPEIRNLNLESWEVTIYRNLAEGTVQKGSAEWELDRFVLSGAALRVKMEEEHDEISRLENANNPDRLFEVLEHSAQSLERARDMDRRFQWFIDDMVFRGETSRLETLYRSRFRFLHAYSGLWLVHQRSGGLTPL